MLLALAAPLALAAGMTCDDARNMLVLNIPTKVIAKTIATSGVQAELVASCPEAAVIVEHPRKARRAAWSHLRLIPPPRTGPKREGYRALPEWVRPGVEVVPAGERTAAPEAE